MSSSQRGQSGQGSFELGSKKKFGKNLNKLQKPPAPPITNGASQRGSGSSRNGLLLLSTKRSSSSGNNSGLLSSKPAPSTATASAASPSTTPNTAKTTTTSAITQPVSIRNESYTSAHDALVDAVMGASRNDAQKGPAWGVAADSKPADEGVAAPTRPVPVLAPGGGITSSLHGSSVDEQKDTAVYNGDDYNRGSYQPDHNKSNQRHGDRYDQHDGQRRYNNRHESGDSWRRSESDDSWRRNQSSDNEPAAAAAPVVDNDQAQYMARLARERAERRRLEEETRMNEQRERAAIRLRELESKIGSQPEANDEPAALETSGADVNSVAPRGNATRTLYDPSRPFSSLLGGGRSQNGESGSIKAAPEPAVQQNDPHHNGEDDDAHPSGPVIHVANYEARDRGERNTSAAPRMLYDPKSGSMVTVNDKAKKGKPKGRRDADKGESGDAATNGKKKKGRNESTSVLKKERRRGDSVEAGSPADETKVAKSRKGRPAANRLPRTCGVLYVRDEKSNCYPADGCDGDQGYGCHGVPGGRTRNPIAHAKFEEAQQAQESDAVQEDYGVSIEEEQQQQQQQQHDMLQGYLSPAKVKEPVIDWVKPNEKIELITGIEDSPTLQASAVPWAPTPSQAAMVAAATKINDSEQVAKSNVSVESALNQSTDDELEDSGDDPDAFMGLGFDPSNMDSVMSSPSVRVQTSRLDAMNLGALSLGVSSADSKAEMQQPSNIFAFGSSATWGSAGNNNGTSTTSWAGGNHNTAASNDWAALAIGTTTGNQDAPLTANSFLSLGSAIGTTTESKDKPLTATSFLSLSSGNTWGTTGLPDFGGNHGTTAD
mmetsp:Transcript_25944/g.43263  ORF Transcript_25944/g.43263 Transcript_25944/m.43263 type:complete len:829 (-) Transcript_25944:346-2832(-)